MLASLGILFIAVVITIMEVPALWRKKLKKEIWVFFVFLLLGVGLSIAQALDMKIPNPLDAISIIYKPFSDMLFGILK